MKEENMHKLVALLSEYLKTDEHQYSPTNDQYDQYLNIFINEIKDGNYEHIDRFSEELATRLTEQGFEPTNDIGGDKTEQHERYNKFYTVWSSWGLIFEKLKKEGLLQI